MPLLVEVLRPDLDPFFGLTEGWHVESDGSRFKPGENFDAEFGEVVFDADGYRTEFRYRGSLAEEDGSDSSVRLWVRCFDSRTQLHISTVKAVPTILDAGAARISETRRRNQFLSAHLSSSFRQTQQYGQQEEGSLPRYKKTVLKAKVGSALFFCNFDWDATITEDQESLEMSVSFKEAAPARFLSKARSRRISPLREFTTYSRDLGVSLIPVSESLSRTVYVDEQGEGYAEGVREGDLLVGDLNAPPGPRQWRRMEMRQVLFDASLEFDFENEEDEDWDGEEGGATSSQVLTFTLRLVPSFDSISDESMEPLFELFADNSNIKDQGLGNTQWQFDCRATELEIANSRELTMSYLRVLDVELSLVHVPVLPSAVMAMRLTLRVSFGVSLAQTVEEEAKKVHSDVALMSVRNVVVQSEFYGDGGLFVETEIKSFQVDDQQVDAPFPVVVFPTPLLDDSISEDAPALKALLSMRAPNAALVSIRDMQFFVAETTLKFHESFLMSIVDFLTSIRQHMAKVNSEQQSQTCGSVVEGKMSESSLPAVSAPAPSATQRRVYVDELDLKPMRFNITFTSASSAAERRASVQIRRFPLISALITAVAAVSDAPLRLGAVRLQRESKTMDALIGGLVRHYSGETMRGILGIAGSTDLLGSPVNLLGNVTQGAFSFFYEPALALSLGYGQIGRGLRKGGAALVSRGAGGLLESLSKITSAIARALAQTSADQQFALMLAHQLKADSFAEPINVLEGAGSGILVLVRSVLDAVVGLFPRTQRRAFRKLHGAPFMAKFVRPVLALLLKPSAGFFAALNQFSKGIRNMLLANDHPQRTSFPQRLPRPRETSVLPYSASRSAGYLLARHRFGGDVRFVMSEICQLEFDIEDRDGPHRSAKHLMVVTVVVTDTWMVACRETLLDVWALPLDLVGHVHIVTDRKLVFECLGKRYVVAGRNRADVVALQRAIKFASSLKTEDTALEGSAFEAITHATGTNIQPLRATMLWDMHSSQSRTSLRQLSFSTADGGPAMVVGGSELDIASCRVGSAEIQSYGVWPDGIYRYQIRLVSVDLKVQWVVERRYSEFLRFRDQACKFLSVSRKSIPLPGRRPWSLSPAEHEARWNGLQDMLNMALRIDLLAESEVLREFLTRGADNVLVSD